MFIVCIVYVYYSRKLRIKGSSTVSPSMIVNGIINILFYYIGRISYLINNLIHNFLALQKSLSVLLLTINSPLYHIPIIIKLQNTS